MTDTPLRQPASPIVAKGAAVALGIAANVIALPSLVVLVMGVLGWLKQAGGGGGPVNPNAPLFTLLSALSLGFGIWLGFKARAMSERADR